MIRKRDYEMIGTTNGKEISRSWEIVTPKLSLHFDSSNGFLFELVIYRSNSN